MIPPTSIDGTDITGATIDGTDVQEITVDGDVVFSAVPDSLISRYTFDNADLSNGNPLDVVGPNDAISNNATTGVSGANQTYTTNEGFSYDGVDDITDFGTNIIPTDTTEPFSISFFVNIDNGDSGTIIGQQDQGTNNFSGTTLNLIGGSGDLRFVFRDSSGQEVDKRVSRPTIGSWTFVVATYDGSQSPSGSTIYYDANVQTTQFTINQNINSTIPAPNTSAGARDPGNPGNFASCDLDDIRIYDKELTSTEVSNLYNNGSIL